MFVLDKNKIRLHCISLNGLKRVGWNTIEKERKHAVKWTGALWWNRKITCRLFSLWWFKLIYKNYLNLHYNLLLLTDSKKLPLLLPLPVSLLLLPLPRLHRWRTNLLSRPPSQTWLGGFSAGCASTCSPHHPSPLPRAWAPVPPGYVCAKAGRAQSEEAWETDEKYQQRRLRSGSATERLQACDTLTPGRDAADRLSKARRLTYRGRWRERRRLVRWQGRRSSSSWGASGPSPRTGALGAAAIWSWDATAPSPAPIVLAPKRSTKDCRRATCSRCAS